MADKMTVEQMQAMIAALQAQNATMAAKVAAKETIHFKVSEKKAVSIMGLQRFPVTLYAGQWERIIQNIDALKAFIEAHKAVLAVKE